MTGRMLQLVSTAARDPERTFEAGIDPNQQSIRAVQRRCVGGQQCLLSRGEGDQAASDGSTPNPKQLSPTMS
jgi:hypothetical protein